MRIIGRVFGGSAVVYHNVVGEAEIGRGKLALIAGAVVFAIIGQLAENGSFYVRYIILSRIKHRFAVSYGVPLLFIEPEVGKIARKRCGGCCSYIRAVGFCRKYF